VEQPLLTDAMLTEYGMPIMLAILMAYMVFIVFKLSEESEAGKWGTFVLFLGLMVGVLGFASKFVIKLFIDV
jgi:hypothetical protein